ncbi:MAG: hypothetical protein JWQ30_630, partial [Sediminibacterium sp.]|nr:hypothetical protein [Sediminibacterium sp.]
MTEKQKKDLIDLLLANRISLEQLKELRREVNEEDLACIIQHIYDLNENTILKISALEGVLKKLDDLKNDRRNQTFIAKIRNRFRDPAQKTQQVILAEGDSWFNYPVLLTDVIDRIAMEKDLAVYSIAKGGDWLLNMLKAKKYVEELSVLHPDWFLISGGGNDLVGSYRLASMVDPTGSSRAYIECEFAKDLMDNREKTFVVTDMQRFNNGTGYLSKDFFALLMFFHLQYCFLIRGILHAGEKLNKIPKFDGIRIITQGYDYAVPSFKKNFGINPSKWYVPFVRLFLGHGHWLKTPLQMRGINAEQNQKDTMYAMITLFNEMMIYTGNLFNSSDGQKVFHIDSRDSVGDEGWTDELHPRPKHFMRTGKAFVHCIRGDRSPDYQNVFIVKNL